MDIQLGSAWFLSGGTSYTHSLGNYPLYILSSDPNLNYSWKKDKLGCSVIRIDGSNQQSNLVIVKN